MWSIERVSFIFLVLIIINVDAEKQQSNTLGILSKYLGKHTGSPLVLVLDNNDFKRNRHLRSERKDHYDNSEEFSSLPSKKYIPNDEVNEGNTVHYINEILRSTGDANDPAVQKVNQKFENALRSRCTAYIICKEKCPKKKKQSCQKGCKQVYDNLSVCSPPPSPPCEKPKCQKYGKTMPPKWRF
ncbi:uncharacterized protein LOC142984252 [Anticarsia gemmatalis]|uniref:uncharacterized protein LOC142984252 n=1 Tax=Anticarsia gemmatalis TaxID=129554 RepID=UPI003F75DA24